MWNKILTLLWKSNRVLYNMNTSGWHMETQTGLGGKDLKDHPAPTSAMGRKTFHYPRNCLLLSRWTSPALPADINLPTGGKELNLMEMPWSKGFHYSTWPSWSHKPAKGKQSWSRKFTVLQHLPSDPPPNQDRGTQIFTEETQESILGDKTPRSHILITYCFLWDEELNKSAYFQLRKAWHL